MPVATRMALVTGGAGFIGSHLVTRLLELGTMVRVFDNFSSGRSENLAAVREQVEVINGDLLDQNAVERAVSGVEVVFHLAALPSVPRSIASPRPTIDTNVTGTLNVLLAARDAGCRRVVFASSSSVYGDTPTLPKHESITPRPLSPYAVSKLSGEQLCAVFTGVYGLETVALRYFNVFGPRQDPESPYAAVIPRFLRAMAQGDEVTVYGDGHQSRDFTYVDNVVGANLAAAEAEDVAGRVFNVASGRSVTLLAMINLMGELLGVTPRVRHQPPRPGDIRESLADIAAARTALGYRVLVPFETGLERTVEAADIPLPSLR